MLKNISKISKKQGCVVVAGHDLQLIEHDFVILDKMGIFPYIFIKLYMIQL